MNAKLHLHLSAAAAFAIFSLVPAAAQDYFREFEPVEPAPPPQTAPYADPDPYADTYASPAYPTVELGQPSADISDFSMTERYQTVAPPAAYEQDHYNMAIGPLHFNVAAGIGVEYNDNITLAPSGRELDDVIIRPSLTVDATWQLSEMNTLRFSLGASYAKYLSNSEYDSRSVLLSPASQLALTILVSNVRITVRDRFSYQEDTYDLPVLDNTATYRRFENDAGIQVDWDINEYWTFTAGYSHYNLWSFQDEFESLERSTDTVYVRPSYQITPAARVGLNASASWVDFTQDIQNDGTSTFIGPFVSADLTENTRAYLEVGWQQFDFDETGTIGDTEDASSVYVRAELLNRLSTAFSHRLGFTKTAEVGFGSNFYDLYHLEYGATWAITPDLTLQPTAFYEYYETSDGDGAFIGEEASRFGTAIGLRYVLTPSVTLGLDYRFLIKDSNLDNASYRQNLVLLSLFYNF